MNRLLHWGAALALSFAATAGDLTITFQNTGKFNEGKSTQYWTANAMRDNHEGTKRDSMVDYQNGVVYTIDHGKKKIEKMSFDDMIKAAEAMEAQMAQLKEQMAQMPDFMKNMMGDPNNFSVEETGKDTVAGRKCKAYRLTVAKIQMDLSLDPDLKIPVNPANFARFAKVRGLMQGAVGPAAGQMKRLYEEMAKLKGVTLKSKSRFPMIGEATSEAIEVKESPVAASVFNLPSDYKVEDVGKKMVAEAEKAARKGR